MGSKAERNAQRKSEAISLRFSVYLEVGDFENAMSLLDLCDPLFGKNNLSVFTHAIMMARSHHPKLEKIPHLLLDRMLREGMDIAGTTRNGDTALHAAAFTGNSEMVDRLLPHIDPELKDADGDDAAADARFNGHVELAEHIEAWITARKEERELKDLLAPVARNAESPLANAGP